jgi:hypothetical protein
MIFKISKNLIFKSTVFGILAKEIQGVIAFWIVNIIIKSKKFTPLYQNEVYDKNGNVLAENCSGSEMKCLI